MFRQIDAYQGNERRARSKLALIFVDNGSIRMPVPMYMIANVCGDAANTSVANMFNPATSTLDPNLFRSIRPVIFNEAAKAACRQKGLLTQTEFVKKYFGGASSPIVLRVPTETDGFDYNQWSEVVEYTSNTFKSVFGDRVIATERFEMRSMPADFLELLNFSFM
jgi:hypothetical protein